MADALRMSLCHLPEAHPWVGEYVLIITLTLSQHFQPLSHLFFFFFKKGNIVTTHCNGRLLGTEDTMSLYSHLFPLWGVEELRIREEF